MDMRSRLYRLMQQLLHWNMYGRLYRRLFKLYRNMQWNMYGRLYRRLFKLYRNMQWKMWFWVCNSRLDLITELAPTRTSSSTPSARLIAAFTTTSCAPTSAHLTLKFYKGGNLQYPVKKKH